MAAPPAFPAEFTTAEIMIGVVVSLLSAFLIFVDAPRVNRSRWWAVVGLLFGGFGLLGWWIVRAFFTRAPAGAPGATPGAGGGDAENADAVKCGECRQLTRTDFGFCEKCGSTLPRQSGTPDAGR